MHRLRRAEKIYVSLRPKAKTLRVAGVERKTLYHCVVYSDSLQLLCDFGVDGFHLLKSQSDIGEIPIKLFADPTRQLIAVVEPIRGHYSCGGPSRKNPLP